MLDMPRQRPPHLQRETTRHGRVVWFCRIGKGPRIRLRSPYGTPEFDAEYRAAIDGRPLQARPTAAAGSLQWLYERYRDSGAWRALSIATRRQRENIFRHVMTKAGAEPASAINRASIVAGRDERAATPSQARNFLDAARGIFRWALEVGHVKVDPTAGVKNPKRKKTGGFPKWSEVDVIAYEARWPVGTRQRVWLDMLLYSGLRRGDVVRVGRPHVRNGVIEFATEKGGVSVSLPILPVLAATLKAGPCGDLTFICGERRAPLTKESFGNMFSEAARAAGVHKSAHGLRKLGATRAADKGATTWQLDALFGWQGGGTSAIYTREADRRRLSIEAIDKLGTPAERTTPAPHEKVRA